MSSIIRATTTSGLQIVPDNSGSLQFQTNGTTTAVTIDTSQNLQFNSGYGSVATAYGCRAWVNFNGTGTVAIRASGNVTSITDNGTGDYTINFTTAMPDVNYSVVFGTVAATGVYITRQLSVAGSDTSITLMSTSQVRVSRGDTGSPNLVDGILNSVSIFR